LAEGVAEGASETVEDVAETEAVDTEVMTGALETGAEVAIVCKVVAAPDVLEPTDEGRTVEADAIDDAVPEVSGTEGAVEAAGDDAPPVHKAGPGIS
jgi:hypothetical protein